MHTILKIYDAVRLVLWAFTVAWALYAIYLVVWGPDLAARANAMLDEEVTREDFDFCTKYGPPPNTHEHVLCTMELKRMRDEDRDRSFNSGLW